MVIESPYQATGEWYKGQVHCHTLNSDGGCSPEQVAAYYYERGYQFLAITDHSGVTHAKEKPGEGFVYIPSEELSNPHMLGLGIGGLIYDTINFERQIREINVQGGLAVLAHPAWMGLTVDAIYQQEGLCGMEVFNFICQVLNGKGQSLNIWDELLMRGKRLWGFAVDDSHMSETFPIGDQAWLMVRAPKLDDRALVAAMRNGNFYGTQGPEIHEITVANDEIFVKCSPVDQIRFIGAAYHGRCSFQQMEGQKLTEASHRPAKESIYCRIEVADENGKTAWSQPMYINP